MSGGCGILKRLRSEGGIEGWGESRVLCEALRCILVEVTHTGVGGGLFGV